MKRIWTKFVALLMIVAMLAAPASALAASAKILKVSVPTTTGSYFRTYNGDMIGSLRNGTRVLYWGKKKGQMLKVMTATGKIGFVYQENVKSYGAMNTKQLYVTKSAAKVYKRVGGKMKRKGKVNAGVPLIVYNETNGWSYVRNLAGKAGYVKTSALKKIK